MSVGPADGNPMTAHTVHDPVRVSWASMEVLSQPESPVALQGTCARCGDRAPLKAIKTVVSHNFTGWDDIDPSADGLCAACAWALTDPALRTTPLIITRDMAAFATRDQLIALLGAPLSVSTAITYPLTGRKHLLPSAEWGAVATDTGVLPWELHESDFFQITLALGRLGASTYELRQVAPPLHLMTRGIDLTDMWEAMRRWSSAPHFAFVTKLCGSST